MQKNMPPLFVFVVPTVAEGPTFDFNSTVDSPRSLP